MENHARHTQTRRWHHESDLQLANTRRRRGHQNAGRHIRGLIDLSPQQSHTLTKMGDTSEAFCRKAAEVLGVTPKRAAAHLQPARNVPRPGGLRHLRTRLVRIERVYEKMRDSQLALGSDLMTAWLEGDALPKVSGNGAAPDSTRKVLSARFSSHAADKEEAAAK